MAVKTARTTIEVHVRKGYSYNDRILEFFPPGEMSQADLRNGGYAIDGDVAVLSVMVATIDDPSKGIKSLLVAERRLAEQLGSLGYDVKFTT